MVTATAYAGKNVTTILSSQQSSVSTLERDVKTFQPLTQPGTIQHHTYQFEGTSFTKMKAQGESRICTLAAPTTIDEETNAAVAAYATFDDIGGNGVATEVPSFELSDSFTAASFTVTSFGSSTEAITYKIPLLDGEGRTAWYQANSKYLVWNPTLHPQVDHSKQFMSGHSLELNVPGIDPYDQRSYVYYDNNSAWNNFGQTISASLWFYPTDISTLSGQTYRILIYKAFGAADHFTLAINTSDSKVYFTNSESGVGTKMVSTDTVNMNAWNNVIFTYNPTPKTATLYLNNVAGISSGISNINPYTTSFEMYIGGLPGLVNNRYTGFIDNFVFWTGKVLTATEVDNMWNHGTII